MAEEQLSIRSTKARDMAHRLAKKQRRTVSQIVELALEQYAKSTPQDPSPQIQKESAAAFWGRIAKMSRDDAGPDIDLEAIIDEHRKPHRPVEL